MRIAIDAGGTFTDVAVLTADGAITEAKSPTDEADPARSVINAVAAVAQRSGTTARELLSQAEVLVHGTTRSLNALVTGNAARTALLATRGHRDILVLREGGRDDPFDHRTPFPQPFVPRRLTFEIDERIDAAGSVVTPLDEGSAIATLEAMRGLGLEAVAVSLLWAHVNPAHEIRVGELVREVLGDVSLSLGHRVNPIVREFRRTSSAALDAALKPIMSPYLHELEQRLREAGFAGDLLVSTSIGGSAPAAEVAERPILSLNSGPSMAPVLADVVAGHDLDMVDEATARRSTAGRAGSAVVVTDTGGTTYDLSVVIDGRIPRARDARIAGHLTGFGSVDVRGLGAGGGSIASVDEHGLLRVGPSSAGADPGPACYGMGGADSTLTDAALLTGIIDPAGFLGGQMQLDVPAAEAALTRLGCRLDLDPREAASAVVEVATETMSTALLEVTIGNGVDPREAVLVAGGGAAGLNSVGIASRVGFPAVIFPSASAVMSAAGALIAQVTAEHSVPGRTRSDEFDAAIAGTALGSLDDWLCAYESRMRGRKLAARHTVDARYVGQTWEISLPVDPLPLRDGDCAGLLEGFHAQHRRLFSVHDPDSPVEVLSWRVAATVEDSGRSLQPALPGDLRPDGTRKVLLHGTGWLEAQRWRGRIGSAPCEIRGPAVIDGDYSSILIEPGATARTSPIGSLVVTL